MGKMFKQLIALIEQMVNEQKKTNALLVQILNK